MNNGIRRSAIFLIVAFRVFTTYANITYEIDHLDNKISVQIYMDELNSFSDIQMHIPGKVWNADYSKQIKNIKVKGGVYTSYNSSIRTGKSRKVEINYDVINLADKDFIHNYGDAYYNYFDKDRFLIFGMGALLYPKYLLDFPETRVTIRINSSVNKIAFNFSPYFSGINKIYLKSKDIESLVIIGAPKVNYSSNNDIDVIIWDYNEKLKFLNKIVYDTTKRYKDFWKTLVDRQAFFFLPIPLPSSNNSWGGTLLGESIISFINPDINNKNDIENLINHETLHFWFNCKVIKAPIWFHEGFTDYYVDKILYTYNLMNISEMLRRYNEKLATYFSSPLHSDNNKELKEKFFQDNEAANILYTKGYLIAGQLDSIINLDDVMRKIMYYCTRRMNDCEFSTEFLLSYLPDIKSDQEEKIKNLVNNFRKEILAKYLFNKYRINEHQKGEAKSVVKDTELLGKNIYYLK